MVSGGIQGGRAVMQFYLLVDQHRRGAKEVRENANRGHGRAPEEHDSSVEEICSWSLVGIKDIDFVGRSEAETP